MNTPAQISKNLPLTEATFYILLSLAREPRHGYAIIKDVQILSEGRVMLSTGTLFGAIKRLLDQNWIARAEDWGVSQDTNHSKRIRKAYSLTRKGREILGAEIDRMDSLLKIAKPHTSRVIP
jgi:DNA-binding PadR family transcriptional regulator